MVGYLVWLYIMTHFRIAVEDPVLTTGCEWDQPLQVPVSTQMYDDQSTPAFLKLWGDTPGGAGTNAKKWILIFFYKNISAYAC